MYDYWWNPLESLKQLQWNFFLEKWGGGRGLFSCPLFKRPAIKKALRVYKGSRSFCSFADEIKERQFWYRSHKKRSPKAALLICFMTESAILAYSVCHLGFSCI